MCILFFLGEFLLGRYLQGSRIAFVVTEKSWHESNRDWILLNVWCASLRHLQVVSLQGVMVCSTHGVYLFLSWMPPPGIRRSCHTVLFKDKVASVLPGLQSQSYRLSETLPKKWMIFGWCKLGMDKSIWI